MATSGDCPVCGLGKYACRCSLAARSGYLSAWGVVLQHLELAQRCGRLVPWVAVRGTGIVHDRNLTLRGHSIEGAE